MGCSISILSVIGIPAPPGSKPPGAVNAIVVKGTATNLSSVLVGLQDPPIQVPVTNNQWQLTLAIPEIAPNTYPVVCGENIEFFVTDPTEGACAAAWSQPLACPACPTITLTAGTPGDCASGVRPVTFTVNFSPPVAAPSAFFLDFGDGTTGNSFPVDPGTPLPVTIPPHNYPPGDWTATLTTILPEGCPPVTVQVHVPPCDCGPPITGVTFTDSDCDPQGNRQVTATAQGGPAGTVFWQWVGLDPSLRQGARSDTQTFLAGTTQQVFVEIDLGACKVIPLPPLPNPASHDVPPCAAPCPSVTSLTATPSSGTSPLTVTFQVTIANPGSVTAIHWDFGDASPGVTGGTTQIHTYTSSIAKTFTATVTVDGGPGCATTQGKASVTVSPPGTGNGGKTACGIARLALALLFALFFVSLAGWACLAWPVAVPIVFGIAIVTLLVLWIVFCHPTICDVLLTIWQTLFVSAMALWYVGPCLQKVGSTICVVLSLAWIAAGVLSFVVLLWWALRKDCDVGLCEILNGLLGATLDALADLAIIYGTLNYITNVFPGCTVNGGVVALLGAVNFILAVIILPAAQCTIDPIRLSAPTLQAQISPRRRGCCG